MGMTAALDASRVVLVADHFAPAKGVTTAEALRVLHGFARTHGVAHVHDLERGRIEHALLAELGLVGHGTIVFGADSHICNAGASDALGIGFGSTDLAAASPPARSGCVSPRASGSTSQAPPTVPAPAGSLLERMASWR